jgi:hypothetical protein
VKTKSDGLPNPSSFSPNSRSRATPVRTLFKTELRAIENTLTPEPDRTGSRDRSAALMTHAFAELFEFMFTDFLPTFLDDAAHKILAFRESHKMATKALLSCRFSTNLARKPQPQPHRQSKNAEIAGSGAQGADCRPFPLGPLMADGETTLKRAGEANRRRRKALQVAGARRSVLKL